MESLISTIVFILPGFMLYFWIQMMGVNPVVKHSVPEFGALAALAWFPVVAGTLLVMRIYRAPINTVQMISEKSGDLWFLLEFTAISVLLSFLLAILYVKVIFQFQQKIINKIRVSLGKAELSESPSVWEEVFFGNDVMVVGITKIGSEKPDVYGSIDKVARPFEPKRALRLVYTEYVTLIITKYNIPVKHIYTDIDAGVNIFIYDLDEYNKADGKEREESNHSTPPRSTRTTS